MRAASAGCKLPPHGYSPKIADLQGFRDLCMCVRPPARSRQVERPPPTSPALARPSKDLHSMTFELSTLGCVSPRMWGVHAMTRSRRRGAFVRFCRSGGRGAPPSPAGSASSGSGRPGPAPDHDLAGATPHHNLAGATTPQPRQRATTPQPRQRATTPQPRRAATTPQPRRRATTPQPRQRATTPQPRQRPTTPQPRRIRTPARPLAGAQGRSHLMSTRTALPRWLIASFSASVSSAMVRLSPVASGMNTGS